MKSLTPNAWDKIVRPGNRIFIGSGASVPFAYKLASVDQLKDIAFGLFRDQNREEICAVGRFYRAPSGDSAEVAFIVGEKFRRLGMSRFLLVELASVAQKRGIKTFWASVLKRNKPMATLFVKYGAHKKSHLGEDSDEFTMDVEALINTL